MYEKLLMVCFVNSSHISFQPISYTSDRKLRICLVVRITNVGRTSQSFLLPFRASVPSPLPDLAISTSNILGGKNVRPLMTIA